MTVAVVGDQVVDLSGAAVGDILTVQADGTVAPETPSGTSVVSFPERASTPSAVANSAIVFSRDDGQGNTELAVVMPTGAALVLARQSTTGIVIVDAPAGTNYPFTSSSVTWADVDSEGTASARPFDVVIPGVKIGDYIAIDPCLYVGAAAGNAALDIATIVSGAVAHYFSSKTATPLTAGLTSWFVTASVTVTVQGRQWYQLQSGDIEAGSVRLRLRNIGIGGSAASRAVSRTSGNLARLVGVGPF